MDKEWKNIIKESCEAAGTYKPFFDSVINTLADILKKKDEAEELFKKSGGKMVVKHTNKGGATNLEKNPCVALINELNRDALSYWKELGLTPASLKRMKDDALNQKKESALAAALKELS